MTTRAKRLPNAALQLREALHQGAWRHQMVAEHVRHALGHLEAGPAGDVEEDYLGHALVRCTMAAQHALEEDA